MSLPSPLPENAGLAWPGEPAWTPAALTERDARTLLRAHNTCGRPNEDVVRRRLSVVEGAPATTWQIDFPEHFTAQEAELYERPWARLATAGTGWRNPNANPGLRRALARVTRFLALPSDADAADWRWIEEEILPDDSLVVIAREDDFTHGIMTSEVFAAWAECYRPAANWAQVVASFPFPWPPQTPLSALTSAQEEQRHAVARAVRSGDAEALNDAVAQAYGWTGELDRAEMQRRLRELHARRS